MWSKILPHLLVTAPQLSEASTNQSFTFPSHKTLTVPASVVAERVVIAFKRKGLVFSCWEALEATSVLQECKKGHPHSQLSQIKLTQTFFFCKPEFSLQWQYKYICTCFVHSAALWILIFMVFFYSHRVFRTTQNEVNPQFSGQPLLHFVSHIKMLENLETLHTLVLNAACWVSQGFFCC